MFGGIVETTGLIQEIHHDRESKHFIISPAILFDDSKIGDSIAVNGVCLTLTALTDGLLHFTAVPETLQLTNLQYLSSGMEVNLERALKSTQRIGGHHVQGHVDATATLIQIESTGESSFNATFEIDSCWLKHIVHKGFITIDGMSLTILQKLNNTFSIAFIPHTIQHTITKHYQIKQKVNIEVDVMSKYIAQHIGAYLDEHQLRAR